MLALGRLRVSSGSALVTELKPRVHVRREKEEAGRIVCKCARACCGGDPAEVLAFPHIAPWCCFRSLSAVDGSGQCSTGEGPTPTSTPSALSLHV